MTMTLNKRDIRQNAYLERSSRARGCARMLIPLAMLVLGTAIWQDPTAGPKLAEGLDEIRPVAAKYLANTPFEDILGPVPAEEVADAGDAPDPVAMASNLPTSTVPVNRN